MKNQIRSSSWTGRGTTKSPHLAASYGVSSGGLGPLPNLTEWHLTPKWHWRSWIRQEAMRRYRYVDTLHAGRWEYRTHQQHARIMLDKAYRDKSAGSDFGLRYPPTYDPHIVGHVWNDHGTLKVSNG